MEHVEVSDEAYRALRRVSDQACWSLIRLVGLRWVSDDNNIFVNSKNYKCLLFSVSVCPKPNLKTVLRSKQQFRNSILHVGVHGPSSDLTPTPFSA